MKPDDARLARKVRSEIIRRELNTQKLEVVVLHGVAHLSGELSGTKANRVPDGKKELEIIETVVRQVTGVRDVDMRIKWINLSVLAPRQGLLVVLSGPSGVGKGTVVSHAMSHPGEVAGRLRRSISVTTRPPRPGEVDGVDYFFRSAEEFARMAQSGELLEWAAYLDHSYGTPRGWVDQHLAEGYDVVLEIEVKGAMLVRERRPEAVLIYMLPPSWEELKRRLAGRGSDDEGTQNRRIAVAEEEVKSVHCYDYAIENDSVEEAASRFLSILEAERWRVGRLDLTARDGSA